MIRTFIQVAGLVFTIEAAVFLAKANLGLSAENIAKLVSTKFGHNPDVVRSLARQRADTWIGFVFLVVAFVFSLWNTLWPMRYVDFDVHMGAVALAFSLALLLGFGACPLSKRIAATHEQRVNAILENSSEDVTSDSTPEE